MEPEGLLFHGLWTEDQSRLHINVLEMKAIFLSLSQAVHKVKNSTVLIHGFPGLRIESLRLPNYCLGLSNNNHVSPTGLSKIVKEIVDL